VGRLGDRELGIRAEVAALHQWAFRRPRHEIARIGTPRRERAAQPYTLRSPRI